MEPKRKRKSYLFGEHSPLPSATKSLLKRKLTSPKETAVIKTKQADFQQPISTERPLSSFCEPESLPSDNGGNLCSTYEPEPEPKSIVEPLYEGSKITYDEASLLLFGFTHKHMLTRQASKDLINLINFFVPEYFEISQSILNLSKQESANVTSARHFYCLECEEYIGEYRNTGDLQCPNCQKLISVSKLLESGEFFITFNIRSTLENMLRDQELAKNLMRNIQDRNQSVSRGDLISSQMYRKLNLTDDDLTCTFNTDGVPVFKSSKFSIWPIIVSLNELDFEKRSRKNVIVALWFGKHKPLFDIFFEPFVIQCNNLSVNDFVEWKCENRVFRSRVYFPIIVTDAVARCLCQGINQFNGSYGCTWCLAKGENYSEGRSRKWVYPTSNSTNCILRTKNDMQTHISELYSKVVLKPSVQSHFGVRHASKLIQLPKFDIVEGFVFDYMHTAFLGISRTFTNLWLNSAFHDSPFYIGLHCREINDRLSTFSVPSYFSRSIRSIDERKFWKATEWRNWTLICLFVLKNILNDVYLRHFSKFIQGIMLLSSDLVEMVTVDRAEALLLEFCVGVENLYGLQFCSFNCHQLLHASNCVRNWGPLWAYSAFQFEGYNGTLLRLFNGSKNIPIEIANRIDGMCSAITIARELEPTSATTHFFNLMGNRKMRKSVCSVGNVLFFGSSRKYVFSFEERNLLHALGISCNTGRCYKTCYSNSLYFCTINYNSKRCDYLAEISGVFVVLKKLLIVNGTPLCIAAKVKVKQHENGLNLFEVVQVYKEILILNIDKLNSKFICKRDPLKLVSSFVKVPNTKETE